MSADLKLISSVSKPKAGLASWFLMKTFICFRLTCGHSTRPHSAFWQSTWPLLQLQNSQPVPFHMSPWYRTVPSYKQLPLAAAHSSQHCPARFTLVWPCREAMYLYLCLFGLHVQCRWWQCRNTKRQDEEKKEFIKILFCVWDSAEGAIRGWKADCVLHY